MKVGDLVKLKDGSTGIIMKVVTSDPMSRRHPWAILHSGERFSLRDLEVLNDGILSDEQLEHVRGGMSSQVFSSWRAKYLNER